MFNSSQSSLNTILTSYVRAIRQERGAANANFISPIVTVPTSVGQFKKYSDLQAFDVPANDALPSNGEPTLLDFGVFTGTYNCQPKAFEVRITKPQLDAIRISGQDPIGIQQSMIDHVLDSAALTRENAIFNLIGNTATTAGFGNWSNQNVDPTSEIDNIIATMTPLLGRMPNKIILDISSYQLWRDNPKTIARHAYGTTLAGINESVLVGYTINPALQIKVATLSKNLAKFNAGESRKTQVIGKGYCYIFYSSDAPTLADPSAFKTFMTSSSNMEGVFSYVAPNGMFEGHNVYWNEDNQLVNPYGVTKIAIT